MSLQPLPHISSPVFTSSEHLVTPAGTSHQSAHAEALPEWAPKGFVRLGALSQPVPVPALALLSNVGGASELSGRHYGKIRCSRG